MSKRTTYAVHPDFRHYPYFPFPFGATATAILNRLLHLDTSVRQREIFAKGKRFRVASRDGSEFAVLRFDPDGISAGERLPATVYYHGGAFVLTYASTHVEAVHHYANAARCSVFLVDYRLAPQHPFPKGFEDCHAALEWVVGNAPALGIDAGRVAVMGDSAGGALAAGVAQKACDERRLALRAQVLVYPVLDRTCTTRSAREYVDTPLFNGVANRKMWAAYLRHFDAANIPAYASPADRRDLSGLPPAYVDTAEFDPLHDEAVEYARRLQAAGVRVELHQPPATIHGYDTVLTSTIAQDSRRRRIEFLRNALH